MVTDGHLAVGLADRSVPPNLVDTAGLRIGTKYLTADQLVKEASQPSVGAVLFFCGRLKGGVLSLYAWVPQQFELFRTYKTGEELWLRSRQALAVDAGCPGALVSRIHQGCALGSARHMCYCGAA